MPYISVTNNKYLVAVPQTQISLATARVTELKQSLQSDTMSRGKNGLTVSALCKLFLILVSTNSSRQAAHP